MRPKRRYKPEPVDSCEVDELQPEWDIVRVLRPRNRSECRHGVRPCPFVGCRYHLYLEVLPCGSLHLNFPELDPCDMEHTCALDLADEGCHTLEEVGLTLAITRERIRQIEAKTLAEIRDGGRQARQLRAYYGIGGGVSGRRPPADVAPGDERVSGHQAQALVQEAYRRGICAMPGCDNPVRAKKPSAFGGRGYAYCEAHASVRSRKEHFRARKRAKGRMRP